MKTAIYILSVLAFAMVCVAAVVWLPPISVLGGGEDNIRYGVYEDRQLVEVVGHGGGVYHVVEDGDGRRLFRVPVRDCVLDKRYRDGRLHFREKATGRAGFINKDGMVTFSFDDRPIGYEQAKYEQTSIKPDAADGYAGGADDASRQGVTHASAKQERLDDEDIRRLKRDNPFYREAVKVLSGKLGVDDADRRHVILNYCEHFRMAYVTKDIDFIRQLFSGKALIIVGNVVKAAPGKGARYAAQQRVEYYLRTKDEYIRRLAKAFAANESIDVEFSDFRIMRHPTVDGIYGVSLRQRYKSDRYADDGWLFLLWDFRDEAMPCLHVRTWQPAADVLCGGEVISLSDFNME